MDAALTVFGEEGLGAARLDEIALRAGLSKGSVYRYFAGKDELYREAVMETLHTLLTRVVPELVHTGAEDYLRVVWRLVNESRFCTIYQLSHGSGRHLQSLTDEFTTTFEHNVVKPFAVVLGQTVREPVISSEDALERSRLVFTLLLGLAQNPPPIPHSPSAVIAFLLRACEMDAGSPQADGY